MAGKMSFRPSAGEVFVERAMARSMEKKLPEKIRTFGVVLERSKDHSYVFYSGSGRGGTIYLEQLEDGTWIATARLGSVIVNPSLSSSSIPAALRNLRGHLGNLAISINALGIKPR